ncbi:hypothetical protein [Terrimonas pollutisoli]|uniref:hypothetical protein n=1 Tax=Terrimonas pollutisoli TaxID=3034147 RepID=UPI0023EBB175|nr:hypothetical protein [Terrimonas sp. H1YJ31]
MKMNLVSVKNRLSTFNFTAEKTGAGHLLLQKKLLSICLFNFFLLSLVGLLLRAYPLVSIPFFTYKNVLHAHSHFAFGGWITPVLIYLILRFFPAIQTPSTYHHWRNIIILMLVSAYGMLLSFPFQGYGGVSIVFSTLFIAAGFYAGIIIRSASKPQFFLASWSFLRTGFLYFAVSSIGPFATAPLIALGKAGTPIYYNAIYFYLHFQYNGFFTFIVLAVLYKMIERSKSFNHGKLVFRLMNIACIPAYALSVLWTQPSILLNITGGAAALVQLTALFFLLKDIKGLKWETGIQYWLFRISIFALLVKSLLQLLSAFPSVAELAYQNRNFVIAYLHLVLIGFISVFVFSVIARPASFSRLLYNGMLTFLFAFISTELLLVLQAGGYLVFFQPYAYIRLLFLLSIFFPAGLLLIFIARVKQVVIRTCTD